MSQLEIQSHIINVMCEWFLQTKHLSLSAILQRNPKYSWHRLYMHFCVCVWRRKGLWLSKLPSTPFSTASLFLPKLWYFNFEWKFSLCFYDYDSTFFIYLQMSGSLLRPLFGVLRLGASRYTHKGVSPLVCGCQTTRNFAQQTQVPYRTQWRNPLGGGISLLFSKNFA